MNRLSNFCMGVVVGAAGLYGAMTFHVVRAEDGVHLVPKVTRGLSDVYVDIRTFAAPDWYEHRGLSAAVVNAQKEYLIADSSLNGLRQTAHSALESLGLK
ncbi:MAG: hypothetical protein ACYC6N_22565 [Pirellulaceae bacterium]